MKGLIYAISHAISDPSVKADAKAGNSGRRVNGLSKHFSRLYLLASGYDCKGGTDLSEMLGTITATARSYVNLFYSIRQSNRSAYIERHANGAVGRGVPPESNLLIMPAMMANGGVRRSVAYSAVIHGLYSMPARFLYEKSNVAMKVELLQQGMGIKGTKDTALSRLSLSMNQMQSLIERISGGEINPEADEMVKELFVNEIVAISESEDMSLAEFINDKLSNGSISFRTALRMVRK